MPTKTWKNRERQIASFFGVERTPLSGSNSKHSSSDTLHPDLFIEQKHRKYHAVVSLWEKTKQLAQKENKRPIITLTHHNTKGFWIVIHSDDFDKVKEIIYRD